MCRGYVLNLLITHIDSDGLGAGILAEHFSLQFDKIVYWDYAFELVPENDELMKKCSSIVLVDLSFSEEYYNSIIAQGIIVEIYDHHESSKWINGKENCVHDLTRSGTKIFFEEYVSKFVSRFRPVVYEFVNLVHTYDTWEKESPLWKEALNLQRVLYKYAAWDIPDKRTAYDRFFTAVQRKFEGQEYWSWNSTEIRYIQEAISREDEVYRAALSQLQYRIDSKGNKFAIFTAGGKISFVCDRLLREDKIDVKYVVCLNSYKGLNGKLSFRSLPEVFDCTTIGVANGHIGASGGTISKEDAESFWVKDDWTFKYKDQMQGEEDFIWKGSARVR